MRRRLILALVAVTLALLSFGGRLGSRAVQAAQTWNVLAGMDGDQLPGGGSLTTIGFFPSAVTINAGDTLSWSFPAAEPHGVAFEAGQMVPFAFQINPGPNPGDLDISNIFLPINLDQINGVYKPGIAFASGAPQGPPEETPPFTLTFTTPGVYNYDCQIHGPVMQGWITVLPAASALSETPTQAVARGKAELGAALGGAGGAFSGPFAPSGGPAVAISGGSSVSAVSVGVEPNNNVAALAFLPGNVTVHRGDTIVFTIADPQEIHTITFLSGAPPPDFVDVQPQPAGPPRIIVPAKVAGPSGGNSYAGTGFLNSGIMFPGNSLAVTINASAGTYQYICLIHGGAPQNMKGTITVVQ